MIQTLSLPAAPIADSPPALQLAETPPLILQYWEIASRRMWLILSIVAATAALGVVLTLLVAPRYTSTARIEIQREQDNVTNVQGLRADSDGQNQEFYQTQYSLLNARSLAERVARRLHLTEDQSFLHEVKLDRGASEATGSQRISPAELRDREQNVAIALLRGIVVAPVRGSALIDVSYVSASPSRSALIANAWIEEFVSQSMDRRFATTSDARRFLEQRLKDLRGRLERSERDLGRYAQQRNIVRLGETRSDDGRTNTTRTLLSADVEALNTELATATARRVEAEGQMDAARGNAASAEAINNPAINVLRAARAQKASDYAELTTRFDPEYRQAKALKRQIGALDDAIAKEERRVAAAAATTFQAAQVREGKLRARLSELLNQLSGQDRATIQYNIYQREVDTNRQLYDGLLQRYKEIGVAGVGANNVAIVDAAIAPKTPSSPKLMLNLALAILTGVIFAAVAVFVLENLDEGLRFQQQVQGELGVPLLGTIPHVETFDPVPMIEQSKGILTEAYMTLRTNLSFTTDHGFPHSLIVTSSAASEGKSTTSYALARLLARSDRKVLLVDIDLRRPRLAKLLQADGARGVSNYLVGDQDWQSMVQTTEAPNLSFVSSGPIPPSPAELLTGSRLPQLVAQLVEHYDHVIFDGPPLLGIADAVLVSQLMEGVVLVIAAERVPVRAIGSAIARLRLGNARILGAALTHYRERRTGYGYGYNYGDHYSYGSVQQKDTVG